ncbi:MAG: hypothetical protein RI925_1016 [Pseudomonadota bacterium]
MPTHASTVRRPDAHTIHSSMLPARQTPGAAMQPVAHPQAAMQTRLASLAQRSDLTAQWQTLQAKADAWAVHGAPGLGVLQRQETGDDHVAQRASPPSTVNHTGLPAPLKAGIESLSGMTMDHVKVHYNASSPAQFNALAYAQGSDIHVAPGQEKHLPHEAWHVVQQAQGRVKPTRQMQGGMGVNDDKGLEREADVMGERALASVTQQKSVRHNITHPPQQPDIQQKRLNAEEQARLDKTNVRLKNLADEFERDKLEATQKIQHAEITTTPETLRKVGLLREQTDAAILTATRFFQHAETASREAIVSGYALKRLLALVNGYEHSGGRNALKNVLNQLKRHTRNARPTPEMRDALSQINDLDEQFFAQYMKQPKPPITVYRGDGRGVGANFLDKYHPEDIMAGGTPDISFYGVVQHTHTSTQKNGMVSTTTEKNQAHSWAMDGKNYGVVYTFKLKNYIHVAELLARRHFKDRFAAQKEILAPGNIPAGDIISVRLYGKQGLIKEVK